MNLMLLNYSIKLQPILPGPPLAMCSPTSKSLVTGFPGRTSFTVDIVENTVEDTDDETAERIFSSLPR